MFLRLADIDHYLWVLLLLNTTGLSSAKRLHSAVSLKEP